MGIFKRLKELINFDESISDKRAELENLISEKSREIDNLSLEITKLSSQLNVIKSDIDFFTEKKETAIAERDAEINKTKQACEDVIASYEEKRNTAKENYDTAQNQFLELSKKNHEIEKQIALNSEKIKLYRALVKAVNSSLSNDTHFYDSELNKLAPTVELHLNAFDVKDLRKLINENKNLTNKLLEKYEKRYTTKSNRAIYQLMVIAIRAEFQNIIADLKYSNLEKCKDNLNEITARFMTIASDGNQQIAPTIKSFINEISVLFDKAIEIEYTYYVRREQEKAEQQALKEQMRQEREEQKALELEQKKVELEEEKYKSEIENTQEKIKDCADNDKMQKLLARIEELQGLLTKVQEIKEDIISRQNGKAGYVYVISNLGSFGDNRFKIGMTRRLEPMDRVRELGDASVPFSFDVHSFIFSDDAVGLEKNLHNILDSKRTNKINMRKEFFDVTIDELEKLVNDICPTAEFKRTMLATEYRKGLEILNS